MDVLIKHKGAGLTRGYAQADFGPTGSKVGRLQLQNRIYHTLEYT